MRSRHGCALVVVASLAACAHHEDGAADDGPTPDAACVGLACKVADCGSKGLPSTSLSGTVFAPNGTLPLYGVNVYVPALDPGPLSDGVSCGNCSSGLPGGAITAVITDEHGRFKLPDVPATRDVPLVIQVGKWRRQLVLPNVAACQDTALSAVETALPRTRAEGDLPRIAITTGNADALECLVRKLGIADSEITTDTQGGRIHLFNGNGAATFEAGFAGGTGPFSAATALWGTVAKLSAYDIVMFSCEGNQYPGTKPQTALEAVRDYADAGGRVFLSHWHNIWVGGEDGAPTHAIPSWRSIGTFDYGAPQDQDDTIASVDQTVEKGQSFASWLVSVGASTTRGQIPVSGARYTLKSNDPMKSDRRVYLEPALSNNHVSVQDLQFTTPNDVPTDRRCGKVVFSDMHVSSGSLSRASVPYPDDCNTGELTPQEKALAFIFFDISSCVGVFQ
jgi:hypothetical protein